jgi:hypothetical protein
MSNTFHLQIDTIALMPGATDIVALGLSSLEGNTWNGEIIVGRIAEGTEEVGGKWNSRQIQVIIVDVMHTAVHVGVS